MSCSVEGMTVEVRTCFAGSLLILSVACLLVLGLCKFMSQTFVEWT